MVCAIHNAMGHTLSSNLNIHLSVASFMRKKGQDADKAANLDILMRETNFDVLYKERFDVPLGMA